jgi:CheY-like chemotaxis protein
LAAGTAIPTILVVDDDTPSRDLMRLMLSNLGFKIQTATNGKEAISLANKEAPDLILMDIIMPEMGGLEATHILKESPATKSIPVVIITASSFEDKREEAVQAGANGFIRKPFMEAEVFAEIAKLLHLTYVYEEPIKYEAEQRTERIALSSADMANLPKELLAEIIQAAMIGDAGELQNIITNKALPLNPKFGTELQRLMDNYEYDKIIKLCSLKGERK